MEQNESFWRAVFKEKIGAVKPEDAWSLRMDETLELYQAPSGWKRFLQDHAYARFTCSECGHWWASNRVILLFHVCWEPHKRQGCIQMRCFQQQCHKCFSKYEEPEFTEESASKVLDRLIVTIRKECYGEHIDDEEPPEVVIHSTGPHRRELCQACQLGLHKGSQDQYQWEESTWEPERTHNWPQSGRHQEREFTWEHNRTRSLPSTDVLISTAESSPVAVMKPCGCSKDCIRNTIIAITVAIIFIIFMTVLVLLSRGLL